MFFVTHGMQWDEQFQVNCFAGIFVVIVKNRELVWRVGR